MTSAPKRRWFGFSPLAMLGWVSGCLKTEPERAFERELNCRPLLDDEAFFQSHYGSTCLPREIPIRLRKLLADQLGEPWARVQPSDKPAEVYPDLDFAELVADAQAEFGVSVSTDEMRELDGSFDSLVRCVAGKLARRPPHS